LLPGCTDHAVKALRANTTEVTEVVRALGGVARQARLAMQAQAQLEKVGKRQKAGEELSNLLTQLCNYAPGKRASISQHVEGMRLGECDPPVLRAFVEELLLWQSTQLAWPRGKAQAEALRGALAVWVQLLRREDDGVAWDGLLQEMEQAVFAHGVEELGTLVSTVMKHIQSLGLSRKQDAAWLFPVVQRFLERILLRLDPWVLHGDAGQDDDEYGKALAVQSSLVLDHWAQLAAQGCGAEETRQLLARCPAGQEVRLASNVVAAAKRKLWWAEDQRERSADVAAAEASARRALVWLAEGGARAPLGALARLWPQVLESDGDGAALETALGLFGHHASSLQGVAFVEQLLATTTQRHLALRALRWLGGAFPRDAVRLWPTLLGRASKEAVARADVAELLELCEARSLEPPRLPAKACAYPGVVKLLAGSPLPGARLAAVQALWEHSRKGDAQTEMLSSLCRDDSPVVSVAAQLAWNSIRGES